MSDASIQALFQQAVVVPQPTQEAPSEPSHVEISVASASWRPLPESAGLAPELAADASPWLDNYIAFSRKWSPRAYDGFNEALALWLLSTVAARRVTAHLGGVRHTSLAIALAARTSLYAKSTTARIGAETLGAAGLSYLLAPDDSTPQAFLQALARRVPENWLKLSPERQIHEKNRLAFAGQRGWFYEEFGQKVTAMMKDGGIMADFRGLLRRFDDCPPQYEYETIGRGSTLIDRPYVALLANLTPADLRPFAKRGAALWSDGFWARFVFITPPPDYERQHGRFPLGKREIPNELIAPLHAWHTHLGVPEVTVTPPQHTRDAVGEVGMVSVTEVAPQVCTFGEGVIAAFYNYDEALQDLVEASDLQDLDGSYARFAEKALRVAMLLGSLENDGRIELRHWARAQQIAERWRSSLHNLYDAVNQAQSSRKAEVEDQIFAKVIALKGATAADVKRHLRNVSVKEITDCLDSCVAAGMLRSEKTHSGTLRYAVPGPEPETGMIRDRDNTLVSAPMQ